jgi:S-adenosylmethionine hydrolase
LEPLGTGVEPGIVGYDRTMDCERKIVTLTTDFGLRDGTVGTVRGVIVSICPGAREVDIAHDIPAHDVVAAALALELAVPCFPRGSLHVAVVDPGVGGGRKGIAVETAEGLFVGPDNGIFELVLRGGGEVRAVELL